MSLIKKSVGQIVFGPVPSRRLGLSLGVDLVPPKTCPLDCIYCEAGRTTRPTTERAEWVPTARVITEVADALANHPKLDYITFSGAGEPTLHADIGLIICELRTRFPQYPLCLITNGVLFPDPELRRGLSPLNLVIPSLDAADDQTFALINRPMPGVSCRDLPAAYAAFRQESSAAMWLEIFVVPGINDRPEPLAALRQAVSLIRPDKIQLNTLDRPGTEPWVKPAGQDAMRRFIDALATIAPVETVGQFTASTSADTAPETVSEASIMAMLGRRPCTCADLAAALNVPSPTVRHALDLLVAHGAVTPQNMPRGVFFTIPPNTPKK